MSSTLHSRTLRLCWAAIPILVIVGTAGCPREQTTSSPSRDTGAPSKAPEAPTIEQGDANPDEPTPPSDATPQTISGYRVVGVVDRGFNILDTTGATPRLSHVPIHEGFLANKAGSKAVESIVWLGCGELIAARTREKVAVWTRKGELVGELRLPQPCKDDRQRAIEYLAEGLAEGPFFSPDDDPIADATKRCESLIRPGTLVETPQGGLAMDPIFAFGAIGTEDDCDGPNAELRMPISLKGVAPTRCRTSEAWSKVQVWSPKLLGESCVEISPYDQTTKTSPQARSWYDDHHATLAKCFTGGKSTINECLHAFAPNPDSGVAPSTLGASKLVDGGIKLCRRGSKGRLYAQEWLYETGMGCSFGPAFWVIDGHDIVAETGPDADFLKVGDTWLYGGGRRWYVEFPNKSGEPPHEFSLMKPAVFDMRAAEEALKLPGSTDDASKNASGEDPSTAWHCLCYSERGSDGQLKLSTACRRHRIRCEGLEQKVRNKVGSYANLLRSCRTLRAAHPGDILGDRTEWEPSSIKGAWWAPGKCLLY